MVIGRVSESNLDQPDDRVVTRFLEQAAPIILESRELAGTNLLAVVALAQKTGLTHQQLLNELWGLEQRGGIVQVAWAELESAVDGQSGETASLDGTADSQVELNKVHGWTSISDFHKKAEEIIGQEDVSLTEIQQMLESEAARLELSAEAVEAALASLEFPADPSEEIPEQPEEIETPDVALPSEPLALQKYRKWVTEQLADHDSKPLSPDQEQAMIEFGVQEYGVVDVLAIEAVREAATEQNVRLQRDIEGASCHATIDISVSAEALGVQKNERLQAFLRQVAPIVASEGGVGRKSRLIIDAAVDRLGLTSTELAQAIGILHRSTEDLVVDVNDQCQRERQDSFRRYLRRFVAQLPEPMITFRAERRLIEAGQLFHGVAPELIKPTINEVAFETGSRFVSRTQALDNVAELMDGILIQSLEIDSAERSRVYATGTQWGLDPIEIETVIRQRLDRARRIAAIHHRRNRWVLISVVFLTITVIGFLLWVFFPQS